MGLKSDSHPTNSRAAKEHVSRNGNKAKNADVNLKKVGLAVPISSSLAISRLSKPLVVLIPKPRKLCWNVTMMSSRP